MRPVLLVMGVSGSGKSTVAEAMSAHLHWPFQEGDSLHPEANVAKMRAGIPLTDADRAPWLDRVRAWVDTRALAGESGLITCSALKRAYRDRLRAGRPELRLLFLRASAPVLQARLARRTGHFMPPSLLATQLATLEPPAADEHALIVDVDGTPAENVAAALEALRQAGLS